MKNNKIIERLPKHLKSFIVDQDYDRYTWQDHAIWRYVMKQNYNYLKNVAHKSYIKGLEQTGIGIDKIPNIDEMNKVLSKIGWAAVTVDGFIPPSAFMEFQQYKVLVIAADIRQIDHIEYTPAPDIIHEAAGHAPIIADTSYAEYLRYFGEIGSKAISSAKDYELYEAIRHLSIIKEDPNTPQNQILEAEEKIKEIESNMGEPSEMAKIRNLHWWTVEYGLIGDINNPKIYGAGLLSSIGESVWCMSDKVKKIKYSIEAANVSFDITKPQPQLFVTPDFNYLSEVLDQFANTMSLRLGGAIGIERAIESKNIATCQYSSGIQVTGKFVEQILDKNGNPAYIKTSGPTMLSYNDKMLIGHDKNYHKDGFGSPVGKLKGINTPIEKMNYHELSENNIKEGEQVELIFESGIKVNGKLLNIRRNRQGEIILFSFLNCLVTIGDKILFHPSWGIYDMAIGEKINSVFSGPADADSFELEFPVPKEKTHKLQYNNKQKKLHNLYLKVRNIRNGSLNKKELVNIWKEIKENYPNEWLLPIEILEIINNKIYQNLYDEIYLYLKNLLKQKKELKKLISDGLALLKN